MAEEELSSEELDALLSAARQARRGQRTDLAPAAGPQSYDFRQPRLLDAAQNSLLENLHQQFCREVGSVLSSSLRHVVDVDLSFSDQATYNDFITSLPRPCSAYLFSLTPPGGPALLSLTPGLVSAVIDRAFGGSGLAHSGDPRDMTPLERNLLNKIVAKILANLGSLWTSTRPLRDGEVSVNDIALESNPDFIQAVPPSHAVVLFGFEINLRRASGLAHLCYPLSTLQPLLPQAAARPAAKPKPPRRRNLDQVQVPLTVQLASGSLSLKEVAELKPKDIIRLDTPRDADAVVLIGQKAKFLARPGLDGRRRAIRILAPIDAASEDQYGDRT